MKNRKILIDQLLDSRYDFKLWIPKGGYFIMADISSIEVQQKYYIDENSKERRSKDMAFCVKMVKQSGVSMVPCSSFYQNIKAGQNMIRFAFCKYEDELKEAGKKIK